MCSPQTHAAHAELWCALVFPIVPVIRAVGVRMFLSLNSGCRIKGSAAHGIRGGGLTHVLSDGRKAYLRALASPHSGMCSAM